jgi:Zn-dependent M28 family amino/carboxypeptidase
MGGLARTAWLAIGGFAVCTGLSLVAQAPAGAPIPVRIDRARLMRDVRALSSPLFEGRSTGTPGALRARAWIAEAFQRTGLVASGSDGFLQPFAVPPPGSTTTNGQPPVERSAANVVGRVSGRRARAKLLLVTAHHDHLGIRDGAIYPGADDNASGVAVLLETARYFVRHPPEHPLMFAALDAEELGQRGARALLGSRLLPKEALAMTVNLDMVSRSDAREIFAAGTSYTPWLVPLLRDVQRRSAVTIRFGHDRPAALANGLEDWTRSSDHSPFHDAGIPFVYFGVEDHADYHKASDTADRIDPRFFGDAADMIVDAVRTLDVRVE